MQRLTGWGEGRFDFRVQDFIAQSDGVPELFDAAFCCELLEHLPEPALALKALHRAICPGGRLFVTAAVRMESADHLTLFRTMGEVAKSLRRAACPLSSSAPAVPSAGIASWKIPWCPQPLLQRVFDVKKGSNQCTVYIVRYN